MGGAAKMASSASHVSSGFPPLPTDPDHSAILFLHDPDPTGVLSNSKANSDSPSWWNPVLSYDVVRNSATPDSVSKTSHDLSQFYRLLLHTYIDNLRPMWVIWSMVIQKWKLRSKWLVHLLHLHNLSYKLES